MKIEIYGDRAIVYYDDGAALQKAILLKQDEHWRVARIEIIEGHY
jgi:hypothetical protein